MAKDYAENKLTYQQLIMRQIRIIQDISSKELRDNTRTIKNLIGEQLVESEDTRYSYLQAVEMLGSMLYPYFGDSDISDEYDAFCELNNMELIEAIKDKDFSNELSQFFETKDLKNHILSEPSIQTQANVYLLNLKVTVAKSLFRGLIKLFKENDFLAEESFGDSGPSQDNGMEADDETAEDAEI